MAMTTSHFQELLVEHIPALRRYAMGLTANPERSDDLVQDTLERAWHRQHTFDGARPLRPWLFTIAHNLHANQVRYQARRPTLRLDALPERTAPSDAAAMELIEVMRVMATLKADQREVLMLVGVEQLSYLETAEVLGVPIGTVMSRLARARERLRAVLAAPRLERVK